MFDGNLKKLAQFLIKYGLTVATAESCTGGLLSSRLTDVSGSSGFVRLNFVTYANEAKNEVLGVPFEILDTVGAVSEECAESMAKGLYAKTKCDVGICTTGIAGPTGGTKEKPVGMVFVGVYYKGNVTVKKILFPKFLPRKVLKYLFTQSAISLAWKVVCAEISKK